MVKTLRQAFRRVQHLKGAAPADPTDALSVVRSGLEWTERMCAENGWELDELGGVASDLADLTNPQLLDWQQALSERQRLDAAIGAGLTTGLWMGWLLGRDSTRAQPDPAPPVKPKLRIEQMYAFVMVDPADNTEGIPAYMGAGGVAMPMVGADQARVESLRPVAEQMAREAGAKVTLCRFEVRTELETLG